MQYTRVHLPRKMFSLNSDFLVFDGCVRKFLGLFDSSDVCFQRASCGGLSVTDSSTEIAAQTGPYLERLEGSLSRGGREFRTKPTPRSYDLGSRMYHFPALNRMC